MIWVTLVMQKDRLSFICTPKAKIEVLIIKNFNVGIDFDINNCNSVCKII